MAVTTKAATNVTLTGATLNGIYTGDVTERCGFQYGTTTSYTDTSSFKTLQSTGEFSSNLSNLLPGTTYHYRAVAIFTQPPDYGADESFTTKAQHQGSGSSTGKGVATARAGRIRPATGQATATASATAVANSLRAGAGATPGTGRASAEGARKRMVQGSVAGKASSSGISRRLRGVALVVAAGRGTVSCARTIVARRNGIAQGAGSAGCMFQRARNAPAASATGRGVATAIAGRVVKCAALAVARGIAAAAPGRVVRGAIGLAITGSARATAVVFRARPGHGGYSIGRGRAVVAATRIRPGQAMPVGAATATGAATRRRPNSA